MKFNVSRISTHHAKIIDKAQAQSQIKDICVVKVDHIGDFITALPALQALKNEFPAAAIDIVCARWNVAMARASRLFREVYRYDFFPENPGKGRKAPTEGFPPQVIERKYDLAIDLRVQEETRTLLSNISARWYAGVGEAVSNSLDVIILPRQPLDTLGFDSSHQIFPSSELQFLPAELGNLRQSYSLADDNTVIRVTAYKKHENLIVAGPLTLAAGMYRASFLCSFRQRIITRRPIVILGAFKNGRCIIERRCALKRIQDPVSFDFSVEQDNAPVDLRLRIRRGRFSRIDFRGVLIYRINCHQEPNASELVRAPEDQRPRLQLHISEQLLLLVNLVACRLNGASFPDCLHSASGGDHPLNIVIAPFSNSIIRDWPVEHYEELVRRLYAYYRCQIVLIGSTKQSEALDELKVRLQSGGVRQLVVEAGKPLLEARGRLSQASIVVSNNSGIAHLAGALGRPVVAIYSASHNVDEWGAVGTNVWQLQAEIACRGCSLDFVDNCHNDRRCMRELPPEVVFDLIKERVAWQGNNQPSPTVSPRGSGGESRLRPFPKTEVDVSILIAAHNRIDLTRACLESVFANADPGITAEVIVTDDCSDDGTGAFLKNLGQRTCVISNTVRRSFGENMNRAACEARGEYLCLLNNDTIVTPGWLAKLLDAARKDPAVGVVGNLHITPSTGRINHAGMAFDREYNAVHLYRGVDPSYPPAHLTREFQMVTGACWLVPRTLFLQMDGFDSVFKNGCEDTDFCLRLPLLDRKVLYVGDSVIYHHGASSLGRMDHEEANLDYFYSKWRGRIKPDLDDYLRRDSGYCDRGAETSPRQLNPAFDQQNAALAFKPIEVIVDCVVLEGGAASPCSSAVKHPPTNRSAGEGELKSPCLDYFDSDVDPGPKMNSSELQSKSTGSKLDPTTLVEQVGQFYWFHSIDLGHGVVTPGIKTAAIHQTEYAAFFDPLELSGRSVIDIGAWNGAYSFEAKRRGAARVLATDHYVWNHPWFRGRESFELARSVLNLDLEVRDIDIPDLSPDSVGTFDVVLFLGVFYHLLDPIAALQRVAKLAREVLVVETHNDALDISRPAMIMYPGSELNNDETNWWGPNPACMVALLKEFGFAKIDAAWSVGPRSVYHAWRTDALRRAGNLKERAIALDRPHKVRLKRRQKLHRGWRLIREGLGLRRER